MVTGFAVPSGDIRRINAIKFGRAWTALPVAVFQQTARRGLINTTLHCRPCRRSGRAVLLREVRRGAILSLSEFSDRRGKFAPFVPPARVFADRRRSPR